MGELADGLRRRAGLVDSRTAEQRLRAYDDAPEPSQFPGEAQNTPESGREAAYALMTTLGGALGGGAAGAPGAVAGAAGAGALHHSMTGEGAGRGALLGAAGEVGGRVAARVVGPPLGAGVRWLSEQLGPTFPRVAAALGQTMKAVGVEPGAAEAQAFLREQGQTLTAGQAARSSTIDTLENIAEKSILGGPQLAKARTGSQKVTLDYIDNWTKSYNTLGTRAERGVVVQNAVEGMADAHNAMVGQLFDDVDQQLGNAIVDRRDMNLLAREILEDVNLKKTLGQGGLGSILRDVAESPDSFMPFRKAHEMRSELLAAKRALRDSTDLMKGKGNRWLTQIEGKLNEAMDAAGAGLNGVPYGKYLEARTLYREGAETWNSEFLRKIAAEESPEVLFDAAVKDGMPTQIKRLREALLRPLEDTANRTGMPLTADAVSAKAKGEGAWLAVQGTAISDWLKPDPITKTLNGERLLKSLENFGDDAGKELIGAPQFDKLKTMARTLYLTQKGAGGPGTGSVAIQLLQANAAAIQLGAVGQMVHGSMSGAPVGGGIGTGAAASIILGPAGIARAFKDPRFVDYFSRGLTTPIGTGMATRLSSQILTRLTELGLTDRAAANRGEPTDPAQGRTAQDLLDEAILRKQGGQ